VSERSGLGPVELAVLSAAAGSGDGFRRSADVLADVQRACGLGPAYSYPLLCDLARPWKLLTPLIDGNGNFGSPGNDPAAAPRYTECRASALGALALAAESGGVSPLAIGLVVGNLYSGGIRPGLGAAAVADALDRLTRGDTLIAGGALDGFWPPVLPGGCAVTGDDVAYGRGDVTTLRLDARISVEPSRLAGAIDLAITAVPYDVNPDDLAQTFVEIGNAIGRDAEFARRAPELHRRVRPPILEVRHESSGRTGLRIVVTMTDVPDAEEQLRAVWGVHRTLEVQVPGGPVGALRDWYDAHRSDGLLPAIQLLRAAARS
jgi:DNA gyrase subunit A